MVLVCGVLSLAACAGQGGTAVVRSTSPTVADGTRISAVERAAEQRGTDIVWVNPPEVRRAVREY
ncbi:hypothetical protein [Chiayiivirga flava]|uniref:Uncharacterized protein n=1 Tax=Chiayiivirga flava TaxID=659595 RepID=A0A7W8G380_9GAMM|nr:hypothetical protein [Chiayiivirga flava]MBB5209495.1 hypothetical protein [Chiayiivirga flava]